MRNRTRSPPFRPLWNASILRAPWSRSMPWDAIPNIAQSILDAKADYLLAVKDNQPTLHADVKSYFETAPSEEVEQVETVGKDHGRIEVRTRIDPLLKCSSNRRMARRTFSYMSAPSNAPVWVLSWKVKRSATTSSPNAASRPLRIFGNPERVFSGWGRADDMQVAFPHWQPPKFQPQAGRSWITHSP